MTLLYPFFSEYANYYAMSSVTEQLLKHVENLPGPMQNEARRLVEDLSEMFNILNLDDKQLATISRVVGLSDFICRVLRQDPERFVRLFEEGVLQSPLKIRALKKRIKNILEPTKDLEDLKRQLRKARSELMLIISWRDLAGWSDLDEVLASLSLLADLLITFAAEQTYRHNIKKVGQPIGGTSGQTIKMLVLALGKLGGKELNFSSDVDLVFAYAEDGETNGDKPISNHEFFIRQAKDLINVLNESTADGFVFRVDMRLRPNGESGPLAMSFVAMENYYQSHGREWERYAFIKARPIAGGQEDRKYFMGMLRPFIFRKYLDYGAIDAVRTLKSSIEKELKRKGIEENIKLGPGGIREIEFIGQAFQLIRGGREPALQCRGIRDVLSVLKEKQLLTNKAVNDLSLAYIFLRNTENHLQMMDDKQLHVLPTNELPRIRLFMSMGFDSWEGFKQVLDVHRQRVHENFSQVFTAPQGESGQDEDLLSEVWLQNLDEPKALDVLAQAGYSDAKSALSLLGGFQRSSHYKSFSDAGRKRVDQLLPLLIRAAGLSNDGNTTLVRVIKVLEAIGRRLAYIALLIENPIAISQLIKLCSASAWITDWIAQHPILLDELLNPVDSYHTNNLAELQIELNQVLLAAEPDDLEKQMNVLREFCKGHVLHVAAADVGPGLSAELVGHQLTVIAEAIVIAGLYQCTATSARQYGVPRCQDKPQGMGVVAYGKFGSREMGYSSDLDMIFLFDSCAAGGSTDGPRVVPNETFFTRVGQRLIQMLTTRTTSGVLYQVDMRLRPSGDSGPLVSSLEAFREYHKSRAWTWERQALVRARFVAGAQSVKEGFEKERKQILCQQRDPHVLAREVVEMREKMRAARKKPRQAMFDLKLSPGAIVDIEFMVQYWVLRWAYDYPELVSVTDNVGLLAALTQAGCIKKEKAQCLIDAYHRYLSRLYQQVLTQGESLVELSSLGSDPNAVAAIWNETFSEVTN